MRFTWNGVLLVSLGTCVGLACAGLFYIVLLAPPLLSPDVQSRVREAEERLSGIMIEPPASASSSISIATPGHDLVDGAISSRQAWSLAPGTRIVLVPHHLAAARGIASLLSAAARPSVVYLVSPDHFSQGKTVLTTTDVQFLSDSGASVGSPVAVRSLLDELPELRSEREPFIKEHGVTGLVPFMTRLWGGVHIVPIMVRIDASPDVQKRLGTALAERLHDDPHALLVDTVDFSHYLPAEIADFHDILAQDVVRSLDASSADAVELDSPGALGAGLIAARLLGLGNVTIHDHTNSLRLLQAMIAQESTSHILASFSPGEETAGQATTLLFTGDMMFDRTVRDRMAANGGAPYPFAKIRGQEGRFFRGQDTVIANLEGPVTPVRLPPEKEIDFAFDPSIVAELKKEGITAVSQANNHSLDQGRSGANESRKLLTEGGLTVFGDEVHEEASSSLAFIRVRGKTVALLGFNITDNPLDSEAAADAISKAKALADHVVVFMHWGVEYSAKPNKTQTDLAHWFIDQGVDAVIGAHPHWMESVEVYKNHPIAYSLGNFIFDQDWSTETKQGLVVGLAFVGNQAQLHLFPIAIEKSQPRLLTGPERADRLKDLASLSDPGLSEMINHGMIATTYEHSR